MAKWAFVFGVAALANATPSQANDWEKYFVPNGPTDWLVPSSSEPEVLPFNGDVDSVLEGMWRRGFVAVGYTAFETSNDKTKDAVKFAKKLKARYLLVTTDLTSTSTSSIPITTPTTSTSYSNGTVSAVGSGGYANGTYSGTTTTTGSRTTYFPITINRFSKFAVYFMEVPRLGTGISPRDLTPAEIARLETRKAFAVRWVRDGSPAFDADILPGDIVTGVNGQPYDATVWRQALSGDLPLKLRVFRNDRFVEIVLSIPTDWRPPAP